MVWFGSGEGERRRTVHCRQQLLVQWLEIVEEVFDPHSLLKRQRRLVRLTEDKVGVWVPLGVCEGNDKAIVLVYPCLLAKCLSMDPQRS